MKSVRNSEVETSTAAREESKPIEIFFQPSYSAYIPLEFLTFVYVKEQPVPVLMTFPVKSEYGYHDAYLLLNGDDVLLEKKLRNLQLEFDHQLYAKKAERCRHLYDQMILKQGFAGSKAEINLKKQFDLASQQKDVEFIREKAQFYNVTITQQEFEDVPNIANQSVCFNAGHRKGLMEAIEYSAINLVFNGLFNPLPPQFVPFDGFILPLTVIYVTYKQHTMPSDAKSFLTSMNHFSLPTMTLYGVTATAFYGVDYTLASTPSTTAVAVLMPVALGGASYVVYHYGRRCISAVADKCKTIPENVSGLCKKFGMKLWNACHRQPAVETENATNTLRVSLL